MTLEKTLHAGNIAAAFAIAATAVDLTLAGGAGTAIGAALSGMSLFKKSDSQIKISAKSMAKEIQTYFDASVLSDGRKTIAVAMLNRFAPSDTDLAKGNLDAATIAINMRAQVQKTAKDPAYQTETALTDYADALAATLGPFVQPQNQNEAILQELLARSDETGKTNRLKDEGITETAIIRLAQRIARETDDLGQAWLTLQDAMDTAVSVQKEGRTLSNHGGFVDQVLARVAELAAEGDYDDAGRTIDAVLAENDAARTQLLESGIRLARLDGDAARAAKLLLQQADLTAGGQADFEALHSLWGSHYLIGSDKGIALDLLIAIEIANLEHACARNLYQRGAALNDLGLALAVLGARESGAQGLNQAVQAYENALLEWTREKIPLQWAMAQNNLGNALRSLGERETGVQRLHQAVQAYENALQEWTREKLPLQWATTQNNLGATLATLGQRESGRRWLEQAIQAYKYALLEWTRDKCPQDWAMTQNNLGAALSILGQRDSGVRRLNDAVQAFKNVLLEQPREKLPLQWAMTQNNLGNVLKNLGQRESGGASLDQAVRAYENALLEQPRETLPMQWAMTQQNLCSVYLAYFDKDKDLAWLDKAEAHARAALDVYQVSSPYYAGQSEAQLQKIEQLRGG